MTIKRIYLRNFRSYEEAGCDFSRGVNVLVGDNAQGKTTLLEALSLLITGRSFRTSHLSELIRFGASSLYLEALFEKNGIEQVLKFSFDGEERKIIHNATALPSVSALLGILHGVILSPEDQSLIKGEPQARRHFLDLLLAQANPLYLHHLSRYLKALKARNTLLKRGQLDTIGVWEEQMAISAAFLTCKRAETVLDLQALASAETLATDEIELKYRSAALSAVGADSELLKGYFIKQFEKLRPRERELGVTLTGPHRDDLTILLHGKAIRHFGSEGQQRSCIAALKLAQWKWLSRRADMPPALCIDDLGVSFDLAREEELYKRTYSLGQVFITTSRPVMWPCHVIGVTKGSLVALENVQSAESVSGRHSL